MTQPPSILLFFRMLRWNLKSLPLWWRVFLTTALFAFVGWRSTRDAIALANTLQPPTIVNVWDAIFISLAGPDIWNSSLLAMLPWFLSHTLFFYLVGDFANGELLRMGYTVIPLVGSRLQWWIGKATALFVLAFGYTTIGFLTILTISSAWLPWSWQKSDLISAGTLWPLPETLGIAGLLGWAVLLFISTLVALAYVQTTLAIIWRHSFYGFFSIVAIIILSWLFGTGNLLLVRWLPGSQSMLLRHTFFDPVVPGFPLEWSLIYNIALALIAIGLGAWLMQHTDIFGYTAMESR